MCGEDMSSDGRYVPIDGVTQGPMNTAEVPELHSQEGSDAGTFVSRYRTDWIEVRDIPVFSRAVSTTAGVPHGRAGGGQPQTEAPKDAVQPVTNGSVIGVWPAMRVVWRRISPTRFTRSTLGAKNMVRRIISGVMVGLVTVVLVGCGDAGGGNPVPPKRGNCPNCNGTGRITGACAPCRGSGWITVNVDHGTKASGTAPVSGRLRGDTETQRRACSGCNGTGSASILCVACGGTGSVVIPPAEEDATQGGTHAGGKEPVSRSGVGHEGPQPPGR